MRSAAAVVAVLVLGMGVSGCGSGGEQSAPSVQPSSSSPAPSATPTPTPTPSPTPDRTAPATPSRAQVAWVTGMCTNGSRLTNLQTPPPTSRSDPGLPGQFGQDAAMFTHLQLTAYLANARAGLRDLATRAARLPATGNPAADALPDAQLRRLQAIAPEVFRLAPTNPRLQPAELTRRVLRVAALFTSIGASGPALQNVLRQDPLLAAAHRITPACR